MIMKNLCVYQEQRIQRWPSLHHHHFCRLINWHLCNISHLCRPDLNLIASPTFSAHSTNLEEEVVLALFEADYLGTRTLSLAGESLLGTVASTTAGRAAFTTLAGLILPSRGGTSLYWSHIFKNNYDFFKYMKKLGSVTMVTTNKLYHWQKSQCFFANENKSLRLLTNHIAWFTHKIIDPPYLV